MTFENLTVEQINSMSAEDFAKLDGDIAQFAAEQDEGQQQQEEEHPQDESDDQDDEQSDDEGEGGEEEQEDDEGQDGQDDGHGDEHQQEEEQEQEQEEQSNDDAGKANQKADKPAASKTQKPAEEAPDHAAFYEAVTGEFKANGQTFRINNPEDVISLMQKGLNYNLKMNTVKPYMTAGRVLEDNGLLENPETLAYLIDLHNKKPEAIARLIKESGLDAYELDEEKANAYKPEPVQTVPENVRALRELIADNKDNAEFNAVYSDANTWDDKSQQQLVNDPGVLETLTLHKSNGVYDKVMEQVNYAVNVQGNKTPVLQLYIEAGKRMFAGGGNQQQHSNAQAQQAATQRPAPVKRTVDPNLAAKRKAISGVKTTATNKQSAKMQPEDIYKLSEAEFAKLDPKFL